MKRRPTNLEGLCDALNTVGIQTMLIGRTEAKPDEKQSSRSVEKARRKSLAEIARLSANAKRITSR
jgi:hypothetical protein